MVPLTGPHMSNGLQASRLTWVALKPTGVPVGSPYPSYTHTSNGFLKIKKRNLSNM